MTSFLRQQKRKSYALHNQKYSMNVEEQFELPIAIPTVHVETKFADLPLLDRQDIVAKLTREVLKLKKVELRKEFHNQLNQFIWKCIQNNEKPTRNFLSKQIGIWIKQKEAQGVQLNFFTN